MQNVKFGGIYTIYFNIHYQSDNFLQYSWIIMYLMQHPAFSSTYYISPDLIIPAS